jgi:hypothetical protein
VVEKTSKPVVEKTSSDVESQLAKLTPDARQRVEDALRTSIDSELSAETITREESVFSRGIVFSRVAKPEVAALKEIMNMEDDKFSALADRVAAIRKIKG